MMSADVSLTSVASWVLYLFLSSEKVRQCDISTVHGPKGVGRSPRHHRCRYHHPYDHPCAHPQLLGPNSGRESLDLDLSLASNSGRKSLDLALSLASSELSLDLKLLLRVSGGAFGGGNGGEPSLDLDRYCRPRA
jgi:hypothetical protein